MCERGNGEPAGMERIFEHWRDRDARQPSLKIVCPYDLSRKRFGLFAKGCPNLLGELMRTRQEQLSVQQLVRKNPTEAMVDKDNHLRDALKYFLQSLPSSSERPAHSERDEIIREAFATGTPQFPARFFRFLLKVLCLSRIAQLTTGRFATVRPHSAFKNSCLLNAQRCFPEIIKSDVYQCGGAWGFGTAAPSVAKKQAQEQSAPPIDKESRGA